MQNNNKHTNNSRHSLSAPSLVVITNKQISNKTTSRGPHILKDLDSCTVGHLPTAQEKFQRPYRCKQGGRKAEIKLSTRSVLFLKKILSNPPFSIRTGGPISFQNWPMITTNATKA